MAISETAGQPEQDEPVSQKVVAAVAEFTDSEPESLDPLYHTIDSEALDGLFCSGRRSSNQSPDRVKFTYSGCDVVVAAPGVVTVTESERETPE